MSQKHNILIVDDQQEIVNALTRIFKREYNVLSALGGREALELVEKNEISVILSDQRMPHMDGVAFLKKTREMRPESIRIMITGYADIEASIQAINEAGIYQYISKPFEPDELKLTVKNAIESYELTQQNRELRQNLIEANARLESENRQLRSEVTQQLDLGNFIGHSPPVQHLFKLVKKVVNTPTTVLLLGETGTGKEMLARMIHYNSDRKAEPFIVQNCGAIPDTLLQSELFGHTRGAFTGALQEKKGLFQQADKGTVFLDEIGDTTPALQLGLLRVLQEGEIKPLGSNKTIHVDVRVIAATNRDLKADVEAGRFREDLYYRLNVFPLRIPPLRERREDIGELVRFFVKKYATRIGKKVEDIDPAFIALLRQAKLPGNVRELENEIERVITLADDNEPVGPELLSERFRVANGKTADIPTHHTELKPAIEELEKQMIERALKNESGNILKAAEELGISRVGLHKMLKRHNIDAKSYKNNQ